MLSHYLVAAIVGSFLSSTSFAKPLAQTLYEEKNKFQCSDASRAEMDQLGGVNKSCIFSKSETLASMDQAIEKVIFSEIADGEKDRLTCLVGSTEHLLTDKSARDTALDFSCKNLEQLRKNYEAFKENNSWLKSYKVSNDRRLRKISDEEFAKNQKKIDEYKLKTSGAQELIKLQAGSDPLLSSHKVLDFVFAQFDGGTLRRSADTTATCERLKQQLPNILKDELAGHKKTQEYYNQTLKNPNWINNNQFKRDLWATNGKDIFLAKLKNSGTNLDASTVCRLEGRYGEGAKTLDGLQNIGLVGWAALTLQAPKLAPAVGKFVSKIIKSSSAITVARTATAFKSAVALSVLADLGVNVSQLVTDCWDGRPEKSAGVNSCQNFSVNEYRSLLAKDLEHGECAMTGVVAGASLLMGGLAVRGLVKSSTSQVEEVLGRKPTVTEQAAITQAHEVGQGVAGLGTYSSRQIDEKTRILRDAGFNSEDIRKLMSAGIVGDTTTAAATINKTARSLEVTDAKSMSKSFDSTVSGIGGRINHTQVASDLIAQGFTAQDLVALEYLLAKSSKINSNQAVNASLIEEGKRIFDGLPQSRKEMLDQVSLFLFKERMSVAQRARLRGEMQAQSAQKAQQVDDTAEVAAKTAPEPAAKPTAESPVRAQRVAESHQPNEFANDPSVVRAAGGFEDIFYHLTGQPNFRDVAIDLSSSGIKHNHLLALETRVSGVSDPNTIERAREAYQQMSPKDKAIVDSLDVRRFTYLTEDRRKLLRQHMIGRDGPQPVTVDRDLARRRAEAAQAAAERERSAAALADVAPARSSVDALAPLAAPQEKLKGDFVSALNNFDPESNAKQVAAKLHAMGIEPSDVLSLQGRMADGKSGLNANQAVSAYRDLSADKKLFIDHLASTEGVKAYSPEELEALRKELVKLKYPGVTPPTLVAEEPLAGYAVTTRPLETKEFVSNVRVAGKPEGATDKRTYRPRVKVASSDKKVEFPPKPSTDAPPAPGVAAGPSMQQIDMLGELEARTVNLSTDGRAMLANDTTISADQKSQLLEKLSRDVDSIKKRVGNILDEAVGGASDTATAEKRAKLESELAATRAQFKSQVEKLREQNQRAAARSQSEIAMRQQADAMKSAQQLAADPKLVLPDRAYSLPAEASTRVKAVSFGDQALKFMQTEKSENSQAILNAITRPHTAESGALKLKGTDDVYYVTLRKSSFDNRLVGCLDKNGVLHLLRLTEVGGLRADRFKGLCKQFQ